MYVETSEVVYESAFNHAQIEITGCCNMNCMHCRASMEKPIYMELESINKVLIFANRNMGENFNLTISGGEPFLHPHIIEILEMGVGYGYKEIVVTTNGSLVTEDLVKRIDSFSDNRITIQVSIDSTNHKTHDSFRGYEGAYQKAIRALEVIAKYTNINSSIRMTIRRETYSQIEEMVCLGIEKKCARIGIGNIIPIGEGAKSEFVLSPQEKKNFLELLAKLKRKYEDRIEVTTEDPLKAIVGDSPWIDQDILENEETDGLFGGCTAGIDCFNVDTEYNMTPCSVFQVPILNVNDYDCIEELEKAYTESDVVKKMFSRSFSGKCNSCKHKRICGGCRATASFFGDGYFCSDGTCWL